MMTSFVSISALSTLEKLMNLIFFRIKCGITIMCYMIKRKKEREQNKIHQLEINESFLKRIRP